MSVDQDVGRGEFWYDWDAVRDEGEVDEVPLSIECSGEHRSPDVGIYAEKEMNA